MFQKNNNWTEVVLNKLSFLLQMFLQNTPTLQLFTKIIKTDFFTKVSSKLEGLGDETYGLYYKHVMMVNYASRSINKLKASLNHNARVVIYDCQMFIVQATSCLIKE